MPWADLGPDLIDAWDQGQHFSIFGPNGSGKSHLERTIVEMRIEARNANFVWMANKRRDPLLSSLEADGWHRIGDWPPSYEDRVAHKILFWPPYPGVSNPKKYLKRYVDALDGIMAEGFWGVVFDEARYWSEQMGLRTILDEMWTGSRSNGITIVAGAQGPSWINTTMREELQWGAFFRPTHRKRAEDLSDVLGSREYISVLMGLRPHEFILARLRTDEAYITKLPKPSHR